MKILQTTQFLQGWPSGRATLPQHSELAMENNDPSLCWFVILCHPNTEFLFTLSLLPFHLVSFTKILLAGFHNISHILGVHVWDALDIFTPPLPNRKLMWRHVLFVSTWCMNFSPQPPLIKKRFIRERNKNNAAWSFTPHSWLDWVFHITCPQLWVVHPLIRREIWASSLPWASFLFTSRSIIPLEIFYIVDHWSHGTIETNTSGFSSLSR